MKRKKLTQKQLETLVNWATVTPEELIKTWPSGDMRKETKLKMATVLLDRLNDLIFENWEQVVTFLGLPESFKDSPL